MATPFRFGFAAAVTVVGLAFVLGRSDLVRGKDAGHDVEAPSVSKLPVDFRVQDFDGTQQTLRSRASLGVAMIFLSTECPLSNQAIPRLNKLAAVYGNQGIEMYGVISDRSVSREAARKHRHEYKIKFPMILDSAGSLRELTGATHTPEAVVFDRNGDEIYRGLIDDSSERLGKKSRPKRHYLADALQAAVRGGLPAIKHTDPVGCLLEEPGEGGTEGEVTFNREIAPIIFANCTVCHRDGEVAPFALTNYEQVSKRIRQINEVVDARIMPPWKPTADYGHFANERRLSDEQKSLLKAWAEAGTPEGIAEDLPPLPQFPTGWQLGKPDVIVRMQRPFRLYADGADLNQHFVVPLGLDQDRLISAIEVHPGNPKIVHHAHFFIDTTGEARILDAADPSEGYTRFGGHGLSSASYLGGWNPGATPHFFPRGTGRLMPRGGDVVFQIHYHPSGKPELDRTEIGLYFAPPGARQLVADIVVGNVDLLIPAGGSRVQFTAEYTLPVNATLMEIRPHMHLLGKSYQVRGLLPTGQEVPLIKIDDWDFNWQDSYVFDPVIRLPAGTRLQILVTYDNSDQNPVNPNSPPKTVYFGEESTDEMSNCAIRLTTDTVQELQTVMNDNGKYWSGEIKRYLDRNMTPDKKLREPKPAARTTPRR